MDRVRFGRALGKGARLAARTAVEAIDAAAAPSSKSTRNPSQSMASASPSNAPARQSAQSLRRPAVTAPQLIQVARVTPAARAAGGRFLAPLRTASRALWLEFTGTFFALFAISFGVGAWRSRSGVVRGASSADLHRVETCCALAVLFAYFSISSFLRARTRAR